MEGSIISKQTDTRTKKKNDRHSIRFEMASSIISIQYNRYINFIYVLVFAVCVCARATQVNEMYISFKSTNFQIGSWQLLPFLFILFIRFISFIHFSL